MGDCGGRGGGGLGVGHAPELHRPLLTKSRRSRLSSAAFSSPSQGLRHLDAGTHQGQGGDAPHAAASAVLPHNGCGEVLSFVSIPAMIRLPLYWQHHGLVPAVVSPVYFFSYLSFYVRFLFASICTLPSCLVALPYPRVFLVSYG